MKVRAEAMSARAKRGLPISSRVPIPHKVLRDPQSGKALRLEVDETKRRLWDDLALVLLEGVGWEITESVLYRRYGHVNAKGEPYYPNYMYRLIMKPLFWGHIARYHNSAESKNGFRYGRWIYDETAPVPEGVVVFRNTHPAVWAAELADKIRQEIDRRSDHMRGKASSSYTHRLSGLAVCGECGHFMATHIDDGYRALYCPAARVRALLPKCGNKGVTSERRIAARVSDFLAQMLNEATTDVFGERLPPTVNPHERLESLDAEIAQLEDQARILICKQITAGEDLQRVYDEEIAKLGEQLRIVKDARLRLRGESLATQQTEAVHQATLKELADLTLEKFWQQESRYID